MPLRNLYIASFEAGGEPAWTARHGLSSAQYQAAFDQLASQGFRLRCVSGHAAADGQSRYTALWDKGSGGAWSARHGLSPQQYQAAFDEHAQQGYRLRVVNAHVAGGAERYACLFEKVAGPAWSARHGLDAASYQAAFDDHMRRGFRARWVSAHTVGGVIRYAALWEQSSGPAWVARHGLEEAGFRAAAADLAKQGYDLVCGNAASAGGRDYYCAIWEKRAAPSIAHHGMTSATYQGKFDELTAQGFRPMFVAGYAGEDAVDVRLRFAMEQQTQGNWCWAATSVSIARFYEANTGWTQCQVANAQKGQTNCCGSGASGSPCNTYGSLSAALTTVGHFDRSTGGITSFADTEAEMLAGRPLGIRTAWSGGGAHFIAATGTEDDSFVWVSDCGSGTTALVDYETLKTSYNGSGTWTDSYFTN